MKDSIYHLIARGVDAFIWGGELLDTENLPEKPPAVFIANHLGPLGPIGVVSSLPLRLYPWVAGEMIDPVLAPEYLRRDFVEPRLKLQPPVSLQFSKFLSKITVPLMQSVGGIQAYVGGQETLYKTLEESMTYLKEGKFLLVFPEYAILGTDSMKKIYPFQKTVFRLGEMYYSSNRQRLGFYPLAVHESHKVRVGLPIYYSHLLEPAMERMRLKNLVEESVREMYQEMDQKFETKKIFNPHTS
ncbi:MAG TPA: hypothetical protein VJZ78_04810 [Anaerolineales bacterium]|nr:hypothetical protein [Anaerolineales bacterium]